MCVSHANLTADMKTTGSNTVEAVNPRKVLKGSQNVKERALNVIINKLGIGPIKLKPSRVGLSLNHELQQKGIKRMNQASIEKEAIELMDIGTLNNPNRPDSDSLAGWTQWRSPTRPISSYRAQYPF